MKVEVLGTGCANCKRTVQVVEDVANARGVSIELTKVENMKEIIAYGVMATPGVVIDGKVVHAGGIPTREKVEQWLMNAAMAAPSGDAGSRCCG
jgi:small redox-active disulfide protein 2